MICHETIALLQNSLQVEEVGCSAIREDSGVQWWSAMVELLHGQFKGNKRWHPFNSLGGESFIENDIAVVLEAVLPTGAEQTGRLSQGHGPESAPYYIVCIEREGLSDNFVLGPAKAVCVSK